LKAGVPNIRNVGKHYSTEELEPLVVITALGYNYLSVKIPKKSKFIKNVEFYFLFIFIISVVQGLEWNGKGSHNRAHHLPSGHLADGDFVPFIGSLICMQCDNSIMKFVSCKPLDAKKKKDSHTINNSNNKAIHVINNYCGTMLYSRDITEAEEMDIVEEGVVEIIQVDVGEDVGRD